MFKLLVDAPSGVQQIVQVGEGGGYFDPARVVWKENVDGPLPQITLGGMVRSGDALTFSRARMDQHTAAINTPTPEQIIAAARLSWGTSMGLSEVQTAALFAAVGA